MNFNFNPQAAQRI